MLVNQLLKSRLKCDSADFISVITSFTGFVPDFCFQVKVIWFFWWINSRLSAKDASLSFFDKVIYVVTWNFIATFDIREAENQQNQLSWQNFQEVMFVYILNRKTEYTQLAVWYTFSKLQWNDVALYHYAIIISVQKLTLVIKSNTTGFLRIQKDNRKILKNL